MTASLPPALGRAPTYGHRKERVSVAIQGLGLARTLTGDPDRGPRVLLFQSRAQDAGADSHSSQAECASPRLPSFHSFHMPLGTSLSPHGANPKLRRGQDSEGLSQLLQSPILLQEAHTDPAPKGSSPGRSGCPLLRPASISYASGPVFSFPLDPQALLLLETGSRPSPP